MSYKKNKIQGFIFYRTDLSARPTPKKILTYFSLFKFQNLKNPNLFNLIKIQGFIFYRTDLSARPTPKKIPKKF